LSDGVRPSFSVVIGNYNYAAYLGAAIESALALDWPSVEVIVVDDGSTDGSRAVIERYGARVQAILKPNGGQPSAFNRGFAAATGDVVFFLDSDDLLYPDAARAVAAVWRPGVSKVQFPLVSIDATGRPTGSQFPNLNRLPTPQAIRRQLAATGLYICPPTSGNAFARRAFEAIFPLPEQLTGAADGLLNVSAPLLGDVVSLAEPHAAYRIHGANAWAQDTLDPGKFAKFIRDDLKRTDYLRTLAATRGIAVAGDVVDRLPHHLQYRLASLRLAPNDHPVPGDRSSRLVRNALRALARDRGQGLGQRAALMAWFLGAGLLPLPLARWFMVLRFVPSLRPRPVRRLLRWAGVNRLAAST
jgi:glycosyltransferase involved in cell wall biosynthesis